jgi:hypothetical protein
MKKLAWLLLLLAALACGGPPGAPDAAGDVPPDSITEIEASDLPPEADAIAGFNDHTLPRFDTAQAFLDYAGVEQSPAQVKFILTDLYGEASAAGHFEEPGFYSMHDEWAWFRLLNGQDVPGLDLEPASGLSFATVAECVAWARQQDELPVGLQWAGDRLYLDRFYDRSFGPQRYFGLGSVLHYPPDPQRNLPGELWLFETEYTDKLDEPAVGRFFARLEAILPPEVAPQLKWLLRSSYQEDLAAWLRENGNPLGERVVTYADLAAEGAWEVYNPGIAAGRVAVVPKGSFAGAALSENQLVVLEEVPDDLPPVAAIVTAVPQTPLAHIGLLARSRGTPNVYLGGAAGSQQFKTWQDYGKAVIIKASADGVRFRELTTDQWNQYLKLKTPQTLSVPMADLTQAPLDVQFDGLGLADMDHLLSLIGGKASGFMALVEGGYEVPPGVMALTVKGYAGHVQALGFPLEELLADQAFVADSRVRFLALEGEEAFRQEFAVLPETIEWLESFLSKHGGDATALGAAIRAGGVKEAMEDAPIDPAWLDPVRDLLMTHFSFLSHKAGLRFRSSSTAEDVEGFNGAGLYDSNTGYLYPDEQSSADKQSKTIEKALRKTWGSYWLFGAFEERRAAGIDHLSGRMGLAVHPTFNDDAELSNGVVTLELVRRPAGDVTLLTVNVQKGALSVTNPPPGSNARPEVDTVSVDGVWGAVIKRVQGSSEMPAGQYLLSEAELTDMHDRLAQLARQWLDQRNSHYVAPQRDSTITLDLEIKRVAQGWPLLADGTQSPQRLVYKQVRTLHDSFRHAAAVQNMPVPRDLLGRTVRVESRTCNGAEFAVSVAEFYTDPAKPWPFDFGVAPFDAYLVFQFHQPPEGLPVKVGQAIGVVHTDASITHPGMATGGPWALALEVADPAKLGFAAVTLDADGHWSIRGADGQQFQGAGLSCQVKPLLVTPQAYLESLMQ